MPCGHSRRSVARTEPSPRIVPHRLSLPDFQLTRRAITQSGRVTGPPPSPRSNSDGDRTQADGSIESPSHAAKRSPSIATARSTPRDASSTRSALGSIVATGRPNASAQTADARDELVRHVIAVAAAAESLRRSRRVPMSTRSDEHAGTSTTSTRCMIRRSIRRMTRGAPPNEMRLSCGATERFHKPMASTARRRRQLQARVRRRATNAVCVHCGQEPHEHAKSAGSDADPPNARHRSWACFAETRSGHDHGQRIPSSRHDLETR